MRHGQTKANSEGRFQGCIDYPLSSRGEEEALKAARRLSSWPIDHIYSSPLKRAFYTAEIIARDKSLQVKTLSTVREFSWGVIEGLKWPEIEEKYPQLASRLINDLQHTHIPEQEPIEEFWERIYRAIDFFSQKHLKDRILVVSHGRFLNAFLVGFLNMDPRGSWPFRFSHGSLSLLELSQQGRRSLRFFNDTCHLEKYLTI